MSRSRATSLFTWLGTAILLLSVTIYSYTQGGAFVLSDLLKVDQFGRVRAAYWSIGILGSLTFLAALALIAAVRKAKCHETAVPLLFSKKDDDDPENPRSIGLLVYQVGVLLLVFVPAAFAIGHANRVLADGVVWNEALPSSLAVPVQCAMPIAWQKMVEVCPPDLVLWATLAFEVAQRGIEENSGRLWLANKRQDVDTVMQMAGDQRKNGINTVASSKQTDALARTVRFREQHRKAVKSLDDPRLDTLLAAPSSGSPSETPAEAVDRSSSCKQDGAGCRGDQWLPLVSPFGIILFTLMGFASSLAAVVYGVLAIVRHWRRCGEPAGAERK